MSAEPRPSCEKFLLLHVEIDLALTRLVRNASPNDLNVPNVHLVTTFTPVSLLKKQWPAQITLGILGTSPIYYCLWCLSLIGQHCSHSPWVILSDFGSAFAMGAVGGTIWHGIKGARNSPRVRLSSLGLSPELTMYHLRVTALLEPYLW